MRFLLIPTSTGKAYIGRGPLTGMPPASRAYAPPSTGKALGRAFLADNYEHGEGFGSWSIFFGTKVRYVAGDQVFFVEF